MTDRNREDDLTTYTTIGIEMWSTLCDLAASIETETELAEVRQRLREIYSGSGELQRVSALVVTCLDAVWYQRQEEHESPADSPRQDHGEAL